MSADELQEAWRSQPPIAPPIDMDLLLDEVARKQRAFHSMIWWRDFREIGVAAIMVPVWIYLGQRMELPWTWYLTVPAILWIAGFLLVDRLRQRRRAIAFEGSLRAGVEQSLVDVEHQIWLLRNVHWWYLLPILASVLAFLLHTSWPRRGGWLEVLSLLLVAGFVIAVMAALYWLNQYAVRCTLEPRRKELEGLLASLGDEPPAGSR